MNYFLLSWVCARETDLYYRYSGTMSLKIPLTKASGTHKWNLVKIITALITILMGQSGHNFACHDSSAVVTCKIVTWSDHFSGQSNTNLCQIWIMSSSFVCVSVHQALDTTKAVVTTGASQQWLGTRQHPNITGSIYTHIPQYRGSLQTEQLHRLYPAICLVHLTGILWASVKYTNSMAGHWAAITAGVVKVTCLIWRSGLP